jgi:hypothetical protein
VAHAATQSSPGRAGKTEGRPWALCSSPRVYGRLHARQKHATAARGRPLQRVTTWWEDLGVTKRESIRQRLKRLRLERGLTSRGTL